MSAMFGSLAACPDCWEQECICEELGIGKYAKNTSKMIKAIDFDGYNVAEIHKMYDDGSCVCTVKQVEDEVTIREDTNIVLMNGVHFELTKAELAQLNPTPETAQEETIQ